MARNGFSKKALREFKARFSGIGGERKKHTPAAIEQRRSDVFEMMCQHIPRSEMARLLGVSRSLIKLDIKYWNQRGRKKLSRMSDDASYQDAQAGNIDQKIDAIVAAAFQDYSLAKSGNDKYKFQDMALKGLALKIKFLQESGYLKKAGIDVRHTISKEPSFADRLGADSPLSEIDNASTRHKLLNLAAQIIKQAEETIDVQATVVDTSNLTTPSTPQAPPV
jgi:hypothetical protein